jgi:hypothetical protein
MDHPEPTPRKRSELRGKFTVNVCFSGEGTQEADCRDVEAYRTRAEAEAHAAALRGRGWSVGVHERVSLRL